MCRILFTVGKLEPSIRIVVMNRAEIMDTRREREIQREKGVR